jgi:DNA-binding response OmpR family regulator
MSDTRPEWDWSLVFAAPPAHIPPRILLAEDDVSMRQLVAEALQKDGYEITEVSDGGRLLVTLAHQFTQGDGALSVDLLVSDVRMPICTGIQILEQLRAARCVIPILLMTAFGDEGTRRKAHSLGAVLIDKPFPLIELRAAVARLLRRRP